VCEESLSGVALLEPVGVVGRSASGKIELRGVKYEKEEAAEVGSSDGTGATATLEIFRSLIVEQRVTVSSWRTLTFSSSFEISLFLLLRLDSRDIIMSLCSLRSLTPSSLRVFTLFLLFSSFKVSAVLSAAMLRTSWSYRLFRVEDFLSSAVRSFFTLRSSEVRSPSRAKDDFKVRASWS